MSNEIKTRVIEQSIIKCSISSNKMKEIVDRDFSKEFGEEWIVKKPQLGLFKRLLGFFRRLIK